MGREVKRVAMNFRWPLNKVWKGFINPLPHAPQCSDCQGTGYSPQAKHLSDQWYGHDAAFDPRSTGSEPFTPETLEVRARAEWNVKSHPEYYGGVSEHAIVREAQRLCDHWNSGWSHHLDDSDVAALIEADRLYDFTHTWTQGKGWQPKDPKPIPTAREVNLWSLCGFGHDACNQWACIKAKCKRLGYPDTCATCKGEGCVWESDSAKQAYENWEEEEPPTGEGWQMWETTSEGSPISPVCESPEALARWLVDNKASAFGGDGATYDQWLNMINAGWAPSAVGIPGTGLISGVAAMSQPRTDAVSDKPE